VAEVRRVKSELELELELMTVACCIADEAMAATVSCVVPGVTNRELQEDVEHELAVRGSRCPSFPTHIFSWRGRDSSDRNGADRRAT
jgi:Xaa-Pro aminopeptidase